MCCIVENVFVSVDNEDLNGELDDVGHHSKNGVISNEFQQALSSHFDSSSHRDNNKDIGKSEGAEIMFRQNHNIHESCVNVPCSATSVFTLENLNCSLRLCAVLHFNYL